MAHAASASDVAPRLPLQVADSANGMLIDLWRSSLSAHAERVACLGGTDSGHGIVIDRVRPLATRGADSLSVPASAALDQCRAPEWLGTVHTHIALVQGQPYVTFSGADRSINTMWRTRWKAKGVFCVLYSASEATCEIGDSLLGTAIYGTDAQAIRVH